MEITDLTALELGERIRNREIGIREALDAVWQRIEQREGKLHCYITLDREGAYRRAELLQKEIMEGRIRSPFMGVPYAVKDNICTAGMRTTCGSAMLEHFVPSYSASAVVSLEKAGAILIGKTNLDEFAMGSSTETSYFGPTLNPRNEEYVPGGSSGGSAAAVAAGECFFALGSDTGGSVRQPASHCGVVGLKPTYGAVSRFGLIAYSSSMDQIGLLTKDGKDGAALLRIIAGRDGKDGTSFWMPQAGEEHDPFGKCVGVGDRSRGLQGCSGASTEDGRIDGRLRVGILADFLGEDVSDNVRRAVRSAGEQLAEGGAEVEECSLGVTELVAPAYYTIACAEASSNLERYDGVKYGLRREAENLHAMYGQTRAVGFGREVKRRLLLGTFVLSEGYYDAYYLKALRARRRVKEACDRALSKYDVLLSPVAPSAAPRLGESLADPISTYLWDVHTATANLAGLPAVSIPFERDALGLPIGVQLIGRPYSEELLLQLQEVFHGKL